MLRLAPVSTVAALLALPAGAAAQPGVVADRLKDDPVYVHPRADPKLSPAEAVRIRIRIAQKDTGRIRIAVVPASMVERAGGLAAFANAVDARLRRKGNLIFAAGTAGYHIITSYPQADSARAALQAPVTEHSGDGLPAQLLAGVDRVAEADPGPAQDLGNPTAPRGVHIDSTADETADKVLGFVTVVFLLVAFAIVAPFVILGLWLFMRFRRERKDEAQALGDDKAAAREELIALGDELRALDLDVSMPQAAADGRAAYERALLEYERANTAFPQVTNMRRLGKVKRMLADGRRETEAAKRLLGAA